jgi:hypothetical protein
MPEKPIIEPIDRSNSPAIIKQACTDRDDAEIRGDLRPVHHAVEIEHARIAGRKTEHQEHHHGAGKRGEFRTAQQVFEPRFATHALV